MDDKIVVSNWAALVASPRVWVPQRSRRPLAI